MSNERIARELNFTTHDNQQLFYRHWPSTAPTRGCVILFHRGHEHSGRIGHLADELALPDFDIFAWDARGHGRSPGERGYSPSFASSVRDVQTFIDHIHLQHGFAYKNMAVLGQSVGAVLVATWVHDYAPNIACQVLASPAFKIKLYVPFARAGLALLQRLIGNFFVNSYVKSTYLTHDPQRQASYNSDPLIARAISVNILLDLYSTAQRIVADAAAITLPTQLLISDADWVVHKKPQQDFFDRLGSRVKEKHILKGFYHDTLGELERAPAVAKVREFILQVFNQPPAPVSLLNADRSGASFEESAQLAKPIPALSPKGLFWAMARLNMRLGACLSAGIKLGQQTGFDSGSTLDYVYRNSPEGVGPIGKLIDKQYLDAIGWRGIRQRKIHIEELLQLAMANLKAQGKPVHILDIAAGHGRYVLEALTGGAHNPDSILLRDYSPINQTSGSALIAAKGLQQLARFELGDAFDRASLAATQPKPTLGIVSGLYELFPDNQLINTSLAGLADAIEPGGYLVYTGQPWHPQLEFIARALTSHRGGEAWVMRRRSQVEMDQLVALAGFEKITQRIDEWGIFTVSLARRCAP